MKYRREIDGLRALAVVPVMLFHAGFQTFRGGFVGVDVFFVISGYLITTIIIGDLDRGHFSLVGFYDRRARRILPALFVVMAASSIAAYAWMMPDDLKNFGQSVLATTLFSNNILLALTSGYWALASEFKPLLHTWSLGVEEQYYICFPFLLTLGWRYFRRKLVAVLIVIAALSLAAAARGVVNSPDLAFYLLPTRAWEILLGSLAAFYLFNGEPVSGRTFVGQFASLVGLALIVGSILGFDQHEPSPGLWTLVPTVGSTLIILCAAEGTIVGAILGSRLMVGVGLISYSAYLWHQPLLAFARIYSVYPPSRIVMGGLVAVTFGLAYATWRFVETPCRNKAQVARKTIFAVSLALSTSFVGLGAFLTQSYGVPSRIYDSSITREEMDKRIYNERVFRYKNDAFADDGRLKVLVQGNSFARDFVNMTTETFDTRHVDIVYRDDLRECILPFESAIARNLYGDADVIVFASGLYDTNCISRDIEFARANGKRIFYIGTKGFGYNLNWLVRLDRADLANRFNPLPAETDQIEREMSAAVPAENYVSLLAPIVKDDRIPVTDESGRPISTDRTHVTKFGARLIGEAAVRHSRYGELLLRNAGTR